MTTCVSAGSVVPVGAPSSSMSSTLLARGAATVIRTRLPTANACSVRDEDRGAIDGIDRGPIDGIPDGRDTGGTFGRTPGGPFPVFRSLTSLRAYRAHRTGATESGTSRAVIDLNAGVAERGSIVRGTNSLASG